MEFKSLQIKVYLLRFCSERVSVETCNYEDIKPEFVFLRENERLSEIINFSLFYPPPHWDLYFSLILKTIS